ncbi:hypothetical protein [Asaia prunellae]|uniref:hypothetical protein n=1 Tax=Asaia prunellae TaxID=610245 RepID=UPI0004716CF2|nr:hypothetical protein [Asaia prunellae]
MNAAFAAQIVQLVVAVAQVFPNILQVIEDAIAAVKSGDGPTKDQIAAALKQAQDTDAAIQAS